jgi:putative heme iron utilization protein
LGEGRPYSALISLPDSPALDPLQIPRLTISGKSARLEKSSPQYAAGQAVYLDKFPGAAMTFGLGDFHLYRLAIEKARFVLGFGRALNVGLETLRGL